MNDDNPTPEIDKHDPAKPISPQPDHSMNEEEPLGWDQAPKSPDEWNRHPRPDVPGGVPKKDD
ncbi:MAG: hypothetical protein AAF656_09315 [Planctomycetota bacterium]